MRVSQISIIIFKVSVFCVLQVLRVAASGTNMETCSSMKIAFSGTAVKTATKHTAAVNRKKKTTTYKQTPEPRATQGTLLPRYCRVNTVHMKSLFKQILMSRLQKLQFNHERYLKLYFAILVLFKFHGHSIQTNMLMSTALFIF